MAVGRAQAEILAQPAAALLQHAVEHGADLVIVNNEETPYDYLASEVIREPIGEAVPRIVAELLADRATGDAPESSG